VVEPEVVVDEVRAAADAALAGYGGHGGT